MVKKAVVLLSGGLDSSTCLALAMSQGFECHALSFCYQQRNKIELEAAKEIALHLAVRSHQVIELPNITFQGSAMTDPQIAVPAYQGGTAIPVTYVPARNTVFLSFALGLAESLEATDIFTGVCSVDYPGYVDCRPEYIAAFQQLANLATKASVEGKKIHINAPLVLLSKAETIQLGSKLGLDYSRTVSCYQADAEGRACGKCDSCHYRRKGFIEAGIPDPTRYVE